MKAHHEAPPTAGLPARWSDWWPWARRRPLCPPGAEDPLLVCSGTAGLVIALRTLRERSSRRDVIVPAYTCPLVAIAIAHCGLRVRVCDTRAGHFDMDRDALAAACCADTLAIIPTHLGGRVADVEHALACARSVGAFVIEDAAQAWGAMIGDTFVGLRGDVGFFSLAVGKGIALYEGGVLVTRDPALRERLRATRASHLPAHIGWEALRLGQLLAYTALYRPWGLPWIYGARRRRALTRGDWIGAVGDDFPLRIPLHRVSAYRKRVGERSAVRWDDHCASMNARAAQRVPQLAGLRGVQVMQDSPGTAGIWPYFLILLPNQQVRDSILAVLAPTSYGVSRLFVHALPDYGYLSSLVSPADAVPNARAFAARSLTITNSPLLDDKAFEKLLKSLSDVLAQVGTTTEPASAG